MSDAVNDAGPAFPTPSQAWLDGMTLRDYFAARAMGVIIASMLEAAQVNPDKLNEESPEICADSCYEFADAMLKARSQ